MKRAFALLLLAFALVALTGPSLVLGLNGVLRHEQSVVMTAHADASHTFWSCKGLGGKRVVPCHPDLGVLVQPATVLPAQQQAAGLDGEAAPAANLWPETELPPPRLG